MLHKETRKLLIEAWNKTHYKRKWHNAFPWIPARFTAWKKECGKTALWKPGFLWREKLQLPVRDETVRKAVLKLGYVYKKKSLHASEQERPRCQGQKGSMEKTYIGERRKYPGISGWKRRQHEYDKALRPFEKKWAGSGQCACKYAVQHHDPPVHTAEGKDGPYGLSGRHYSGTVCRITGRNRKGIFNCPSFGLFRGGSFM